MKKGILFSLCIALYLNVDAQVKQINGVSDDTFPVQSEFVQIETDDESQSALNHTLTGFTALNSAALKHANVSRVQLDKEGIPIWIELKKATPIPSGRSVESAGLDMLDSVKTLMQIQKPSDEFVFLSKTLDENQNQHIRFQQVYNGLEVYGAEVILHEGQNGFNSLNGRSYPTPDRLSTTPQVTISKAQAEVITDLEKMDISLLELQKIQGIELTQWENKLVIYHIEKKHQNARLSWMVSVRPNYKDHWIYFVDAISGHILKKQNHVCSFINASLWDLDGFSSSYDGACEHDFTYDVPIPKNLLGGDGPATVFDGDLHNSNRLVNSYQISNVFYMIDATKETMFNGVQSILPDEPIGAIWTIDAQGTSPQNENFSVSHVANSNNNWNPLEVSAHYNGGEAFEYFLNTFSRNSINGSGGNIISLINVKDENGLDMDNAFWNGAAMFYGNGLEVFESPLAKALDVAGHEMSHGVIQNTANLEYVGQSGALNESFADIFGAMIDREDWKMGEDVVDQSVFTTGALRDLSNPNNGGNQLGDPGWQPKNMDEYQNLPETPQGDFGGVHINSGIANHAFYLFANEVGRSKAEQVYFKALNDYLVKSSQFIDARNAVIQSAKDLHGENSPEVSAAAQAFDLVGIGAGEGGNYQEDLVTNPGDDVVIATDEDATAWYYISPSSPANAIQLNAPAPLNSLKLSMTDDGKIGVYVDQTHNFQVIEFDWTNGLDYEVYALESNPQGGWRNIVISKDGSKIAYLTENLNNSIRVYDFVSGQFQDFELFNPTTSTNGSTTGDVQYADVMEFDYTGEFLMYDALNLIPGSFGDDITYWDISFVKVWDQQTNDFGSGQVGKLFTSLPENVSIGNATFAKNSPYVIAFDFIETERDIFGGESQNYFLKAANLETGDLRDVFNNLVLSYPTFSRTDERILFDANDTDGNQVLALIEMEVDKITPIAGTAGVFVTGASKGTWSQTGERSLTTATTKDPNIDHLVHIYPNPAQSVVIIETEELPGDIKVSIYNQMGQLMDKVVQSTQSGSEKIQLNTEHWPHGLYEIEILTEVGSIRKKVVKSE
jgi:Zn-dependent metalloprotease